MVIYNLKFSLNIPQNNFALSGYQIQPTSSIFGFDENYSTLEKAVERQEELLQACMLLKINPTHSIREVEIK